MFSVTKYIQYCCNDFNTSLPAFYLAAALKSKRYRRTALSTSFSGGSMTLEAALVFPFFLFLFVAFSYFFLILNFQMKLQLRMTETLVECNKTAYILSDQQKTPSSAPVNIAILRAIFFNRETKDLCKRMPVKNGEYGISLAYSSVDPDTMTADLVITYTIKIPFIPDSIGNISFVQHCREKLFTGKKTGALCDPADIHVFVAEHGSVYHTDKYCSYLLKYTDTIPFSSLGNYSSRTGKSYRKCSACASPADSNDMIYLCDDGYVYHTSKTCRYLRATTYEFPLSEVSSHLPLCSRCKIK